ncbi:MAG TPA: hypothetical protein VGX91_06495 [Candidatus Cybelea sp.]|nr:hypothetical protein [Candidatus Cybelea sp.]
MKWMVDHGRRPTAGTRDSFARHETLHERGFLPLPAPGDLPVIVAARLGLSFPVLMSALRLYAVDDNPQSKPGQDGAGSIEAVWFSDGGLSSNFPISFFDSPIPKWPTLAITLESFPSPIKNPTLDESVWMATDNNAGIGSVWDRFSQAKVPSNTPGFYGAIVGAMQNWQDTMQSEVPGFRDRIAHVRLTAAEGGLNLTMPPQTIQALMARGDRAGELLVEHFQIPVPGVPPFEMTWTSHRWVRTRTALDVVQRYTEQFEDSWNYPQTPSYRDLIAGGLTPASMSYPFVYPGQVTAAQKAAGELLDIAAATQSPESSLSGADAPAPISDLVVRPRY